MSIDLVDQIAIDAKDMRLTGDGYLVAMPRVARTGIQLYRGFEVGMRDKAVVRVYRPPNQVFAKDSMHSFAYKPITNDHPPEPVTSDNWTKYSVGNSGGEVARDGEYVRVPMVVMDKASIKDVNAGKKELSVGYATDLIWGAGTVPTGEADAGQVYDAMQTAIRVNHIAIVDLARGGDKLAIGDQTSGTPAAELVDPATSQQHKDRKMSDVKTTIMTVDGISVSVTDDTAAGIVNRALKDRDEKIGTLGAQVASLTADGVKIKTDSEAAMAKLTAENKVVNDAHVAEIAALKKQVEDAAMTPAKLDTLVKDRAGIIEKAKAVLGDKLVIDGKTDGEIRKQVVDAKLADAAKTYTDDQVKVAFDTLTAGVKIGAAPALDSHRATFSQPAQTQQTDKAAVISARDKRLQNAWKGEQPATKQ